MDLKIMVRMAGSTIMNPKKSMRVSKNKILLALSLWGILLFGLVGVGTARPITLREAVEIALKSSPLLQAKGHLVSAKGAELGAAKGGVLPQIDLYGDYTRTSDPQVVVPIKSFRGTPPEFSRDLYGIGLDIKIPIYEGGRLRTNIRIKELENELATSDLKLTQEEVAYLVRMVFSQLLYLDSLLEAQEGTCGALKRLRMDSKKRLDLGRLRPVDLMRIDAQLKDEEAAIIGTREAKKRALHLFLRLLGKGPDTPFEPLGRLEDEISNDYEVPLHLISSLIDERPDIKRAIADVNIKKEAIRLEKGLNYPSLDLVGGYGRRAGSGFEADEEVWSAGIRININVFSGGVISHRIRRARHEYLEKEAELKELRLRAVQEVRDALSKIQEARARIDAQKRAAKAAEESFRIEKLRYETGAGTVTDVLISEAQWLRAQAALSRALYDLELGKAALDRALGRTIQKVTCGPKRREEN